MSVNNPSFVAWQEHIVCQERGNRVVHFHLKDAYENLVLAVIGTERSIRHMIYVVSEEFVKAYGANGHINASTKWRARREVVDWLTSIVSNNHPQFDISNSQMNDSTPGSGSVEVSEQMVPRKIKAQHSDIAWSGVAWICAKQLRHYPSFCRNRTSITVHSFVFIMAEEKSHYLGYLEDMHEDKKGMKKVKVRWFHCNQEVRGVISQLNPHPSEVFITPHVQVISAECVDGLATVLTPKHYEKFVDVVPHDQLSAVYMCFRQFKNNKIKPFTLTKLRGYHNQAILSSLDCVLVSKQKVKCHKFTHEDGDELAHHDPVSIGAKRRRSTKGQQKLESSIGVRRSAPASQKTKCEPTYPKLKLRLSRKTMGVEFVGPQPQYPASFKVDEKVEMLCQDSGIRGCWFRCKVLRVSQKNLKIQFEDVQDADESGNLEEWVPASRVAAPDRLGMRCQGRLTIRPCPPKDLIDHTFEVGAPVDAWWCDGWWEGVVTRIDRSETDGLQVYLPGEDKFLTVDRKDVRTSRDWFDNKWVDIKAKPDILYHVAANVNPSMKLSTGPTKAEASGGGSSVSQEYRIDTNSKVEDIGEDKRELPDSAVCTLVNLGKLPHVNGEVEIKDGNSDGVIDDEVGKDDVDDEVGNNDVDNVGDSRVELVMEEHPESARVEIGGSGRSG
ncbi:BAH domain-containing protein/Agenet domain-containing protein [Cephalotus follicularis]|uniref:BAH domain-containing protein/Agenet domain-containing protein n=1 Tax=Cephalotus follicularis TaxID=3775 RepID=A0A1Q3AW16_CEPFO|nr:BAH domain-containing protein/Agenet domain-containing protein [Cephalotus follicularis]